MKTREQIITSMCYTWRHDYGLLKEADPGGYMFPGIAGMTREEQQSLWQQMAQLFDNDIAPELEAYQQLQNGNSVILPRDREHAEAMVKVGMFYLENSK
jgi:hypothetical protein